MSAFFYAFWFPDYVFYTVVVVIGFAHSFMQCRPFIGIGTISLRLCVRLSHKEVPSCAETSWRTGLRVSTFYVASHVSWVWLYIVTLPLFGVLVAVC